MPWYNENTDVKLKPEVYTGFRNSPVPSEQQGTGVQCPRQNGCSQKSTTDENLGRQPTEASPASTSTRPATTLARARQGERGEKLRSRTATPDVDKPK